MADHNEIVVKKLQAMSKSDALDYIGQLASELCEMAKATNVPLLVYLLNETRAICEESREDELSIVRVCDKLLDMPVDEKSLDQSN